MDVGCPKCQTEYELEDDRVPDDGVTVKCTNCGYVFRVKRKSLVVTLPVREGTPEAMSAGALPPAPPPREWKVRKPDGAVMTCRELTALQRWIVEGKVGREDEISLVGDAWKRLGSIAELESFFQVFEEARQARALQSQAGPPPPPAVSAPPRITETWRDPQFKLPPPEPVAPPPPEPPRPAPPASSGSGARPASPSGQRPAPPPRPAKPQPLPMAPTRFQGTPDEEFERVLAQGNRGKLLVLIIGGLALGGGTGWYFGIHVPEQRQVEAGTSEGTRTAEAPGAVDAGEAVTDAGAEAADAGDEADAGEAVDAGEVADAGALTPPVEVDAGVATPDAGEPAGDTTAARPTGPAPKRSYELLMAQAERLRQREKPEAALDLYGTAHELKPGRVEPLVGRGLALLELGNHLAAASSFEDALKLNGRNGPALMGLAEALRLQGKNERAVEYYRTYLEVLPNGVDAAVARNNIERLKR